MSNLYRALTAHRRRVIALVALVLVLGAGVATIASVRFSEATSLQVPAHFAPYIYRTNGARADPVNLVFRGATSDAVADAMSRVLGWKAVQGSPMLFFDAGQQRASARQLGIDLGNGSRLHIRIEDAGSEDGRDYVLAAVHRDDSVPCGHVGRAFDDTRDRVLRAFTAAGYQAAVVRIGNVEQGAHCDGTLNGGDGALAVIDVSGK